MRGRRVPVASAAVSSLNMPAFFGACKWQLVRHPVEPTAMSVVRTDDRVGVALRRLARQAQSEDNKVIKQGAVPRPVRPCNVTQHSLFLSLLSSYYGAAERCSECRQLVGNHARIRGLSGGQGLSGANPSLYFSLLPGKRQQRRVRR